MTITCSLPFNLPATAQIIPDNSLGNESSVVVPNQNINGIDSDRIDGGAIRGSNLFHSFQEFNIDNGRGAYFSNPENISNILTRVTGSNISNIFGTLGVLGNANLFLINPNGIVFGPNARLDVGGSFFASTADSILFENSVEFAASNPDAPPLLTINIPIGLNFRENPGDIVNQAALTTLEDGSPLRDNNGFLTPQGLNVPQNQTLGLIGGDVLFDNGVAISPGSNIELGGLSQPGIVELNTVGANGNTPILQFPSNIQQANIILTNESQINVRADNGGDININAGNFGMGNGSIIRAGIDAGLGFPEAQGGDVNINAQNSVIFTDPESSIRNNIDSNAIGNPGDININANSLLIEDGAFLNTTTFGNSNAGNVTIQATDSVQIINSTGITSSVNDNSVGNGGTIEINTAQLELLNGGQIVADTAAIGNAGNIIIRASEFVEISGTSPDGELSSSVFANVRENAIGNGGNILVETGQLRTLDGGIINAATLGEGNAGNISIQASETVEILNGTGVVAGTNGLGNAGNITIKAANSVRLINGDITVSVEESGIGNGGTVEIDTARLELLEGAQIIGGVRGQGNPGNIIVRASDAVTISGVTPDGQFPSALFIEIEAGAVGNGGNILVETNQLQITDEGVIVAQTSGEGNAGNITIRATEFIEMTGLPISGEGGNILANANPDSIGNAGNITIETGQLRMINGAQIAASTNSVGNAGTITVEANNINLIGNIFVAEAEGFTTGILAQSDTAGNAGTVIIEAQRLRLTDGAVVGVAADGAGDAGTIIVRANDVELLDGLDSQSSSTLDASVKPVRREGSGSGTGSGGSVTVEAERLVLRNGGRIEARTVNGTGESGQVTITASESVELSGITPGNNFGGSIFTNTIGSADAGDITIVTGSLSIRDIASVSAGSGITGSESSEVLPHTSTGNGGNIQIFATDSVELVSLESQELGVAINSGTFGQGNAGNISIETGQLLLENDNSRILATTASSGDAGNIDINVIQLQLINGSVILADTEMNGNAGRIEINATELVELNGQNNFNLISAGTSGNGDAGDISITTNQLRVINGGGISVSTSEGSSGNAGELSVNAAESVELRGSFTGLLAATDGSGNAGNINIETGQLSIRDRAVVTVNSDASGIPGNINISANETFLENRSSLIADSEAGQGGSIRVQSNDVRLLNGSIIGAVGSESGETFEGNIEIDADLLVLLGNSGIITNAFSPSGGSNINIQPFNDSNVVIIQSADSIIRAAGNLNIDSSVTFQPAEVPEVAVTDPNDLIAQEFCRQRGSSDFVIRGRGGIAVSPNDKSDGNQINVDLVEPVLSQPQNTSQQRSEINNNQAISSLAPRLRSGLNIIPARGWIRDENGDVILVSYDPTKTGIQRQQQQLPDCQSE
ncbi:MAG: filamentous hemagglutinin N-terminal domain-containing protein [Microcoleaceae cyanobacterium]